MWIDRVEARVWSAFRRVRPATSATSTASASSSPGPSSARESSTLRRDVRFRVGHLRDYVRAYHAWRDVARDGAWARRAAAAALGLFDVAVHQVVVTCGPPHMVHEAGGLLARRVGVPHVMDLRDPWSLVERRPEDTSSPVWYALAERYERRAVAEAALVVMNTAPAAVAMAARYPAAVDRILTVMNGYDDELPVTARRDDTFRVAYAGTIYIDRDPRPLFRAAGLVIGSLKLSPGQFAIDLMGHVVSYEGKALAEIAREENVGGFVHLYPAAPRRDALAFQAGATMLVSLPQDSEMAIPSKVFEYMLFQTWILAVASPGSATAGVLSETDADVVPPGDVEAIARVLRRRYEQFAAGARPQRIGGTDRFSRRRQAELLFDAIDRVVAPGVPANAPR
jgi:hypothetical protein